MSFVKFPTWRTAAVVYLAGVTKRWAEAAVYDRMTELPAVVRLRSGPPTLKYVAEALLNWLGALVQANLPETTPTQRFLRMILEDAPSEIAKRVINGGAHEPPGPPPGRVL